MITIQVDTKEATRWLDDVQRKQIPFATSVALNRAAFLSLDDIKREVNDSFDRHWFLRLKSPWQAGCRCCLPMQSSLLVKASWPPRASAWGFFCVAFMAAR